MPFLLNKFHKSFTKMDPIITETLDVHQFNGTT